MTLLNQRERAKLIGILSRLSSDFDGECSAAALLATRLLKANNLQWDDLITHGDTQVPTIVVVRPTAPIWRLDLAVAMRHVAKLKTGEQNFAHAMTTLATASPKQRRVLAEIAEALRAQGLQ